MATTELSDNEKAEIMTEFSKSMLGNVNALNAAVGAVIANNSGRNLKLYDTHNWSGDFQKPPIGTINAGKSVQFLHVSPTPKGAIIYGGDDQGGSNHVAYLLAWSLINGTRRVYVKCGLASEVHSSRCEIAALASLDSSGSSSAGHDDSTSSKVSANIRDESGTFSLSIINANLH